MRRKNSFVAKDVEEDDWCGDPLLKEKEESDVRITL